MSAVKPSLVRDASDEAYGEAMVRCHGYAPACSDACECLQDGMCFTAGGAGWKAARRKIAELVDNEPNVYVRSWLKLGLDALDHNHFLERGALDAMRLVAINKQVRKLYGER